MVFLSCLSVGLPAQLLHSQSISQRISHSILWCLSKIVDSQ